MLNFDQPFQHIEYIKEITKYNKNNLKIIVIYHENLILTILPFEIKKCFYKSSSVDWNKIFRLL